MPNLHLQQQQSGFSIPEAPPQPQQQTQSQVADFGTLATLADSTVWYGRNNIYILLNNENNCKKQLQNVCALVKLPCNLKPTV